MAGVVVVVLGHMTGRYWCWLVEDKRGRGQGGTGGGIKSGVAVS